MKKHGTSMIEQAIFYYIKKLFPDALNKHHFIINSKKIEVDIYIPSIRVAVEYDGSYWHKSKIKIDEEKNRIHNSKNISVIRIREKVLCQMEPFDGEIILLEKEYYTYYGPPFNSVKQSVDGILNYINKRNNLNFEFYLTEEEYRDDLQFIYALFFPDVVELSHAQYCGSSCWDENNPIPPENLPQNEWALTYLTCPNGNKKILPRYRKRFVNDCEKYNVECNKCMYNICPLLSECKKTNSDFIQCEYMRKITWDAIKKGISYSSFNGFGTYESWLFDETRYGIELVKKFISSPTKSKYRKNILRFLHFDKSSGSYTVDTTLTAWTEEDIEILKIFREQLDGITIKIEDKTEEYGDLREKN